MDIIQTGDESSVESSSSHSASTDTEHPEQNAQQVEQGRTGFLATTAEEYASTLFAVALEWDAQSLWTLRRRARVAVRRFSESEFDRGFLESVSKCFE